MRTANSIRTSPASRAGLPAGTVAWLRRRALPFLLAWFTLAVNAEGLQVGEIAPAVDIETIGGQVVSARQLEGKVVLHYFWASWCPICRGDMPELQKLYQSHRTRGFEIIAHSLDEDQGVVIDYWREHGYTFSAAMRSDAIRAGYGPIRGTPTFFLVNRAGTVRLKRLGVLPEGELGAHIKTLLSP
jgi:thiol-disulfide isomerase/thioredoxin